MKREFGRKHWLRGALKLELPKRNVPKWTENAKGSAQAQPAGAADPQTAKATDPATSVPEKKKDEPSDKIKCPKCGKLVDKARVAKRRYVCPECNGYFRVTTAARLRMTTDRGSFEEWFADMPVVNPLGYEGYEEKLSQAREKTGLREAFTVGSCKIFGEKAVVGVCDARFMMASMGSVYGEKVTAAIERATTEKLPMFLFCSSGGARMQEGIMSLMQMAKTSAAIRKHGEAGLLYVTILTDPTTGGVTASFAMLGDVIMAEPGALIGFAGPRVIKQTIGQKLPEGFQSAEFLLEHGFVDGIVKRMNLKKTMYFLIVTHRQRKEGSFANFIENGEGFVLSEILKERSALTESVSAWDKVRAARHVERPSAMDYVDNIFDYFVEQHGDRYFGEDAAIVGGIAFLDGQPVTIIADVKGKTMRECQMRNFGMPRPEGYRKALRLMKQAEKFGRPVISFINTSGAFCGIEAEERGQGEAIARNLLEMAGLTVPVLCILIGEGGSGGALATAVGNEVWMLENATYSILSPEGFASILWKDATRAKEASEIMNITAQDLLRLGVIEKILPEYGGATAQTAKAIAGNMKEEIKAFLRRFDGMSGEEIAEGRYQRFRKY
ncbi:MAG: acetyl-CoA carboxylase carboxyltransferase subunit alpha [Acetatifactor sp.]|nr:acetyl-CoA carboxylase carboxyltransferase subunit alpha [Acetatifactor sp.]